MVSKIGFIELSILSLSAHNTPKNTPNMTDKKTESPISANVSIADSHMPTSPQKKIPNKTNKANLKPPAASDGIIRSDTTNNHEESTKKFSNAE